MSPVQDPTTDPAWLAPRRTMRVERPELGLGAFELRSPEPLATPVRCVGAWLERWAHERPEARAVAEPAPGGGWTALTWRGLREAVGRVAQGLLDLRLPPGQPIVVLSDNALEHLVLLLAGQHIGQPVCTVSSAYTRLAGGRFERIHAILAALDPALVYASDAAAYGAALDGAPVKPLEVYGRGAEGRPGALAFSALATVDESPAVQAAFEAIRPDSHAKYLLTSGSTGRPKVVINTHRMLCANQQMIGQTLRFLAHEPPVLLDWLPWSHTFGANHNTNLVLAHGGTLYIDDGRPLPGLIDKTLAHLRDPMSGVQPTICFNVPRGFEMLLPALEAEPELARRFLGGLRMLFYAGAGMPVSTWQRLEALAAQVRPPEAGPLWMTTSWGSTETSPAVTFANWRLDRPGVIGLPLPGVRLKFVPIAGPGSKLEMRVKGDNVFPGYRAHGDDSEATQAVTRAAFDDEGFYCIGDAGHLRDATDPLSGVVFDGRVAEDFKLTSGTWVNVGMLRLKVLAALAPWVQDAVIAGHDRAEIGLLLFLTEAGRALPAPELRGRLHAALLALGAESGGSAATPRRAFVLPDAPSAAEGEITDKGYLNQRRVLERRADALAALYADDPGAIRA